MAGAIPDIVIRLTADVDDFIRDWDRAADAAERAAARIRAAGAAAGDGPDASRFRDLNSELERLTRTARQAADAIREHGNASRRASEDTDSLARRLRELENSLGGASRGFGGMAGGMKGNLILLGILASFLPGIVAGLFALGAAATGIVLAFGVAALGARGLGQAFDRLERAIAPLKAQLDSIFRVQLGNEFAKLGQAITSQLTPAFKGVARAIADLIKDTTQWIRSAEGMSTIKTAMQGVEDLVRALSPAVKGLVQIFLEFAASAAPSMKKIGDAISEVVTGLRDMFREATKSGEMKKIFDAGAEAIKGFGEIIKGVIAILMEMASQGGLPAAEAMKKLGQALQDAAPLIGMVFRAFAENMDSIMTVVGWLAKLASAFEGIKGPGGDVLSFFVALSNPISLVAFAVKDLSSKWEEGSKQIGAFLQTVGKGWDKLVDTVKQAMDKTVAAIKQGWDKAHESIKQAWDKANATIKQAVDKVTTAVKQGIDKANAAIKQGWDKANAAIKQTWDKIVSTIKQAADKAVATVKQWVDKVSQAIKQGVDKAIAMVKEWWDKMPAEIKSGADRAVEEVKSFVGKVIDALKEMPGKALEAGKAMVEGLIQGAKSMAGQLIETFKRMAEDALRAVKQALGIASPSKIFSDEVGVQIPAGIAQGIRAGAPALNAALAASMRQLPLTANVALAGASRGSAIGLGGTGRQVIEVKLGVGSGGDGLMAQAISKAARTGQLKISANAIVGGR